MRVFYFSVRFHGHAERGFVRASSKAKARAALHGTIRVFYEV
jgi:hypothetical protein